MKPGPCHEPLCDRTAAWGATKLPAWCQAHAAEQFRNQGLDILEPVQKRSTYTLTQCRQCGCKAHYKLEYALSKGDEKTCRACFWKQWAANGYMAWSREPEDLELIKKHAEANGYEYLGPLATPSLNDDPHHVRCVHCHRLSAKRAGDIGWGCTCQRRIKRPSSAAPASPTAKRATLQSENHPALQWWDHERNDPQSLETATLRARREVHWVCPNCDHRFTKKVMFMTNPRPTCPVCEERETAARQVKLDYYRDTMVSEIPELLDAWDDDADPTAVPVLKNYPLRRFRCPTGHHPRLVPYTFLMSGCPSCRANETRKARKEEAEASPEITRLPSEIAQQWHPTANGKWVLATVSPISRRAFTWKCAECDHTWKETPKSRSYTSALRCPQCRSIFDSLAYHHPDLALEWADTNPLTAWQVRPTSAPFTPSWVCATNPRHVFTMTLNARTNGGACPECSEHGKSRIELAHYEAALKAFDTVTSGRNIRTGEGSTERSWRVDIAVDLPDGEQLLIEYDGAYWHQNKVEVDVRKTLALLEAGHRVVRLRERPLENLPIEPNDRYLEIKVNATTPDPDLALSTITNWLHLPTRSGPSTTA